MGSSAEAKLKAESTVPEWLQRCETYGNDSPQMLGFFQSLPNEAEVEIIEINNEGEQRMILDYIELLG